MLGRKTESKAKRFENLEDMPNIGKTIADKLRAVGITTPAELQKVGSKKALLRLRERDPGACASQLYALEGAIQGIRWHYLTDYEKRELKEFQSKL